MVHTTPISIPSVMKAAVVTKHKAPLELKDVPVPEPGPGEVLVQIMISGVCHTDVHVADGDWDCPMPTPIIPGHEGCGVVVKLGSGVDVVALGDRVGIPWLQYACGNCFDCRDGWETFCLKQKCTGFTANGGFAQYAVAPAAFVGKIPDALTFEQAAPIMCAGVTVYKALKVSNVKPGQWVVITGAAGGLGHVACQYAKAMGMKVIAVTRKLTPQKESMFKGYDVDYALDLSAEGADEGVKKATNGQGAHGAVCLAPSNQDISEAVVYVRPRGYVVPVGLESGLFQASTLLTVVKGVTIVGSIVGTRNDLQEAMEFAANGKVKCLVTTRKFEEVNDTINELRKGLIQGRVVMEMPKC